MKKILLIALALVVMLAPACTMSKVLPPAKTVTAKITVTYDVANATVVVRDDYPDPSTGGFHLKWGDTVTWAVSYNTVGTVSDPAQNRATVTISGFTREYPAGSVTDPFPPIPPIPVTAGSSATQDSTSRAYNAGMDPAAGNFSSFKYSIQVEIKGLTKIKIDPRVIFDS